MIRSAFVRKEATRLRWRLALALSVLVVVVLVVTWFFQVYLIDDFYEHIKRRELTGAADYLCEHLEEEAFDMIAYSYAVDGAMTISAYRRLPDGTYERIAGLDAAGQSGLSYAEEWLDRYCHAAYEAGGTYIGQFLFGGLELPMGGDRQKEESFTELGTSGGNVRLICIRVAVGETGNEYVLLLNASLQPLKFTVQTLQTQYLWILLILLACVAIIVFFLYRYISAPLMRMNESAKQLALGKYDVEFSGKGYRESSELAASLNYAARELSQLDRLQKELIANISHDLRTPLTMIKGYGEIMRDLPGENTPENMQVIIDEAQRLSTLVNDLLDLSRLQSGASKIKGEVFDITAALRETITRYDTLVAHMGYHISMEQMDSVQVYADRGMILQVLYNLINNAVNYTGEDKTVTVSQTILGKRVRISVSDSGGGIAEEQIPLVWDRYYRIDKFHCRTTVGTGLGLSIVKEILELHKTAYGVQSTVGKGSVFWFELPIIPQHMTPLEKENNLEADN